MGDRPIRHHTVPKFYLQGFAAGKRLIAVEVATERRFETNVTDATTENHFYSVSNDPSDSAAFEEHLGKIEAAAGRVFVAVLGGEWPLSATDRAVLATFMTLQFLRGPDHRLQVDQILGNVLRDLAARDPDEFERISNLSGAPAGLNTPDAAMPPVVTPLAHIHQIGVMLPKLVGFFMNRAWTLYQFDEPSLVTSDAPVTPVPDPALGRSAGLGVENADAMLFPLSRRVGLLMNGLRSLALLPGVAESAVQGALDLTAVGNDSTLNLFNNNAAIHAHRRLYHHPGDAHLVPKNLRDLSSIGGRIDFSNPPPGLASAP